jgi:signal transduction histidine kinase/ActR/RegA family two-component response regulator
MPTEPAGIVGRILPALRALRAGRFDEYVIADVERMGGDDDAARKVSSAYFGLVATAIWLTTAGLFALSQPDAWIALTLTLYCAAGCCFAYLRIRWRLDPRPAMGVLIIGFLVLAAILVVPLRGPLQTGLALLPVISTPGLLFRTGLLRVLGMTVAIGGLLVFGVLANTVLVDMPAEAASPLIQLGTISLLQAMVSLRGVAVINRQARSFTLRTLQATHDQLMASTARHQLALEAARMGLWDWTLGRDPEFVLSPSITTITGYTAADLKALGADIQSLVHPEDLPGMRDALAATVGPEDRIRLDFRMKTRSRGYRWFALRARIKDAGHPSVALSGSIQDIQFIKAVEDALRAGRDRALEADRAKADFIAVMSHEVRTPLNAILGSIAVLRRGRHDAETRELLTLADEAGAGLMSVVNDLLDVSRIEAGKMDIESSPVDILALASRTLEAWRPQATARGLSLALETPARAPPTVRIDPARIRQILGNLISNAIKYTAKGGVTVSLKVTPHGPDLADIEIVVSDTGGGIAPELAQSLFQPFERARHTSGGGTGLGLYISRNLAKLMGGSLELEDTSEAGSRFCFRMRASLASPVRAPAAEMEADPEWTGAHILAVDDNEANRRIAALVLAQFGARPTVSDSGEDALQRCEREPYDVILMDIVMPGLDGFATLARLRATEGPNQKTPVIALTARLSQEDIESYKAAGFDGVAAKPIDIPELARVLAPFMMAKGVRAA